MEVFNELTAHSIFHCVLVSCINDLLNYLKPKQIIFFTVEVNGITDFLKKLFDLFGVQVHLTKICYVYQNISQIWEINEHLGDPTLSNWNRIIFLYFAFQVSDWLQKMIHFQELEQTLSLSENRLTEQSLRNVVPNNLKSVFVVYVVLKYYF